MEPLVTAAIVLLLGLATLAASLYGARRLGLTDAQKARRSEEAATLDALRTRLGIVEANARDLRAEVETLKADLAAKDVVLKRQSATIAEQSTELATLHELISDGALDALKEALAVQRRRPTGGTS